MNKESYWERRQAQNMYEYMEDADKTADQISVLYLKSSQYINKSLDKIFERYRTKHRLSETETLLLLNTMQDKTSLAELRRRLKEGDGDKKELAALLEAPAYAARLERLEHLMGQIDQMMTEIYLQEKQISTSHYIELAQKSYYHTVFDVQQRVNAAFSFSAADTKTIDRALHSKWSGKNYSERIWGNTQVLADRVKEELLVNLLTGRTNREAAEIIEKEFAKGAANARRLVWTESAQMGKELNFKAYEEMKVEKYRYLATLDLKTCEKCCRPLDRKVFPVKDRQDGVNCPPMHPWCRCTTVGVVSEELEANLKRRARDPITGKGMLVPMTMAYQEWYDKYVKSNPDAEFKEKKVKAFSADKAQYEKYKKALGRENVPKTLDAFQNAKHRKTEEYGILKAQVKGMSYYNKAVAKEPEITAHVKAAAFDAGMKTEGLEYRIKAKDSFLRKIAGRYDPNGNTYEVKDILRYTYTAPPDKLAAKISTSIETHEKSGYNTVEVKNYWLDKNNPYNGVNTVVKAPNGQKFELQYHTPESFNVKNGEMHKLYEKHRSLTDGQSAEGAALEDKMFEISDAMEIPKGIEVIKNARR